jgi:hypothetical protein
MQKNRSVISNIIQKGLAGIQAKNKENAPLFPVTETGFLLTEPLFFCKIQL